jgi:hypothetical protein
MLSRILCELIAEHLAYDEASSNSLMPKGKDENQMSVKIDALSGKRICERCGQRPGEVYPFYYGKKKFASSRRQGNRVITTTSYDVAGRDVGAACDECLERHRIIEGAKFGLITAVCAAVAWGAYLHEGFSGRTAAGQAVSFVNVMLLLAGGGGFLIAVICLLTSLFTSRASHGENLVIALKKGALRKQGFDSFWNTEFYSKLRRR